MTNLFGNLCQCLVPHQPNSSIVQVQGEPIDCSQLLGPCLPCHDQMSQNEDENHAIITENGGSAQQQEAATEEGPNNNAAPAADVP